jgi:hypothetical protein
MGTALTLALKFGLGFLRKYWLHLLFALVIAGAVWHYMDLRGDLKESRLQTLVEKQRAEAAWEKVRQQNAAIRRLQQRYDALTQEILTITNASNEQRADLERTLLSVQRRITQLINTPPAATTEEQCRAASEELNNVQEVIDLLNR